jgi:thiamine kinase-like enzyme
MMKESDFNSILQVFGLKPASCRITEFKRGHINDSYIVHVNENCVYFLQRINHHVFKEPEKLIGNLIRVNKAMNSYHGEENNPYPDIMISRNNKYFHRDHAGNYWRMMEFVPDSHSYNIAGNYNIAREGAAAFSHFQRVMNNEVTEAYIPTIPDFHHLGKRLEKLQQSIDKDAFKRVSAAKEQVDFALDRLHYGTQLDNLLKDGSIPLRVTHNDTKLNNVLFSKASGKHICVVDLDTVMPGTVLYDYGDMVRTFTSPVEEDEPDPSEVVLRKDIFEALTEGYLGELKDSLTDTEKEQLLFGAKIMLLMIGVRFLTDFLEGDHYFKTSRDRHNLERCRNQFVLLRQLEDNESGLREIISKYS